MALSPGGILSHYRLVEKIGEGGMGVVWKAEDTVLGRQVAIKILPEAFASDTERLARFRQEARLLASLNHPNIAAIYGLEEDESDGIRYLVLELVPGQTLAERIARGPLPVEEALAVCRQITAGLEAAHERGIIHRDLKPANVKVTPDGSMAVYALYHERAVGFADLTTGKEVKVVPLNGQPVSLDLSHDGRSAFASAQDSDTVYVLSIAERKVVHAIKTPPGDHPDPVLVVH